MIEVFKTNVSDETIAVRLVRLLKQQYPESRINFDLQDCDNILRIEGKNFVVPNILELVRNNGFHIEVLD